MMNPFDPSKMDPKILMELSQLIRQLPPDKINRMQTLMHNMMAGFDVRREMDEFERGLPPGFREKILSLMMASGAAEGAPASSEVPSAASSGSQVEMDVREARMTILRAVSDGRMSPEEAERLLFQS